MYLGIDLGTTVLKIAVFDARTGKRIGSAAQRLRTDSGDDGKREQSPRALLQIFQSLLNKLAQESLPSTGWKRLRGIGVASQGGSTMFVRRGDGLAQSPLILWSDTRAAGHLDTIRSSKTPAFWRKLYCREGPCMGVARMRQSRESHPTWFSGDSICVGAGEYLFFHITGQWFQDAGHALQAGCYDAGRQCISAEATAIGGTTPSFYAALRRGHETSTVSPACARAFGLPEGVPVAGPYMDHEAGYMAVSHASRYPIQCSLGTAWVGNFTLPAGFSGYSKSQLLIPSPVQAGHMVVQAISSGNMAWDWALQTFVDTQFSKALAKQEQLFAKEMLPPDGLIWLPWIGKRHPFQSDLHGAGVFVGISPGTTRDDLTRAVATGLVAEFARTFSSLVRHGAVDSVMLCGGASAGRQFVSLLQSLFSPFPVLLSEDNDYMGNRGSLYAFGGKACRCGTRPAPVLPVDEERLQRWYGLYGRTLVSVYGKTDDTQPYSVKGQHNE